VIFAERESGREKQRKMKNSVSDHSFYIESDEEDDAEKESNKAEENNDGNVSDSSDCSADNQQQNKTGSYNTSWPQSYRFVPSLSLSVSVSVPLCLFHGFLLAVCLLVFDVIGT
jgi:vesicular inhibitory amino acid transporter